jgi:hypothetical protein
MALTPNGLADAIEVAFESVWGQLKPDDAFPVDGKPDRRVLFLAIARGLLTYLEDNENAILDSITLDLGSTSQTFDVDGLDFNADLS